LPAHVYCSTIYNNQALETAQMLLQLMNGLRKCGIHTQWSFIQP
jgi:hypothetical protein